MEQLLLKGADIDAQSDDGRTPLHMTCHYGRFTCSKILIDHGLSVLPVVSVSCIKNIALVCQH